MIVNVTLSVKLNFVSVGVFDFICVKALGPNKSYKNNG